MPQPAPDSASTRRPQALQQRVAAAIVEAAARVLAERGSRANMADVAEAAGVARATVYRYFPNRQALLAELGRVAVTEASERLAAARIHDVAPADGIVRAIRVLVEVGDPLIVLARERVQPDPRQSKGGLAGPAGPLRRLIERGQAEGIVRDDVPSSTLVAVLVGLVVSVVSSTPALGREDAVETIAKLFLDGARR
jgi:AcrR family transcriptional regulator